MGFWGPVVGAGIGALGSYLGSQEDREATGNLNEWNILEQRARDLRSESFQREMFDRNVALQREFAQNGIRWRAEDAAAAGLHPLAALGASGSGYQPSSVSVGGGGTSLMDSGSRGSGYRALGQFGQDVGRAIGAVQTPEEKAFKGLQLERMAVDNDIAKMELVSRRQRLLGAPGSLPGENAGYTIDGQPDVLEGKVRVNPSLVTSSERGAAQQAAGASPLFDMYKTKRGFLGLLNQKASEATEDDYLAKLGIHLQSLFSGRGGPQSMTENFRAKPGHRFAYGGPLMGYGEVRDGSMTVWEAMHEGSSELWRRMRPRGRGNRFYNFPGGPERRYQE